MTLRDAFRFRPFLVGLGIAALAALAIHALSGLSYWASLVIAIVAMLINGWFAEWEDNQPGGFNNPKRDDSSSPARSNSTSFPED